MPLSLEEVMKRAKAASEYAQTQVIASGTRKINSLLTAKPKDLDRSIEDVRQLYSKRYGYCLENQYLFNFEEEIEHTSKYSLGNCQELVYHALDYILNSAPDTDAEMYRIQNGDHVFLVLNREKGSNASNPETWGPNAVICDPWANKVYKATEYLKKLKNYNPNNKNNVEALKPNHKLVPYACFHDKQEADFSHNTAYLRPLRKIETIKENFTKQLTALIKILTDYLVGLDLLITCTTQQEKQAILLSRIVHIKQQIGGLKAAMTDAGASEYKEYRDARSQLMDKYALLKQDAIAAMQFSSVERSILLAPVIEPGNKSTMWDMFRDKPKTTMHDDLKRLADNANKDISAMKTKPL